MGLFGPEDAPTFAHPDLAFVQALTVELALSDGRRIAALSLQDDDEWFLHLREVTEEESLAAKTAGPLPLFRIRACHEFPVGRIESVTSTCDDKGRVQEVSLHVSGQTIHLKAGEVVEAPNDQVVVRDRDESVLVFLSDEALRATVFNAPFYLRPIDG